MHCGETLCVQGNINGAGKTHTILKVTSGSPLPGNDSPGIYSVLSLWRATRLPNELVALFVLLDTQLVGDRQKQGEQLLYRRVPIRESSSAEYLVSQVTLRFTATLACAASVAADRFPTLRLDEH